MIKYFCDCCGRDVKTGSDLHNRTLFYEGLKTYTLDLCGLCRNKMDKRITQTKIDFIKEQREKHNLEGIGYKEEFIK